MRWKGRRISTNVEDRRGGGRAKAGGFSILGVVVAFVAWKFFGIDPQQAYRATQAVTSSQSAQEGSAPKQMTAEQQEASQFVGTVLADTEDVWTPIFQQMGISGEQNQTELSRQDQVGDFAQAYVIAHEVGHHIQNLLGISGQVQQARAQASKTQGNQLSVRLELQADCLAGIWAHQNQQRTQFLEQGDIEEAMDAAQKIGDDYLQKRATGQVVPDSFTHGSSEQRMHWFQLGLKSGDVNQCDTFK